MSILFIRWLIYFLLLKSVIEARSVNIVVLTQNFPYEIEHARMLKNSLQEQRADTGLEINTIFSHEYFEKALGTWVIWPVLRRLSVQKQDAEWTIFCEPYTKINVTNLVEFLNNYDFEQDFFISRALRDENPVIIHHFYGFDGSQLLYPDFAASVVFSKSLLKKLIEKLDVKSTSSDFTIDPKFELAKLVYELTGVSLTDSKRFCLLPDEKSPDCIATYEDPKFIADQEFGCGSNITNDDVFFGIKTFSGYHRSRLVYVKRTWAKYAKFIEYFSDSEDPYVPTIDIGIPNTEKGHCAKTISILKHFLEHHETANVSWVVIADDDTLLSVPRLYRLLTCMPTNKKLIIGERYGYGFSNSGNDGYDYPTGGAGMIFSRSAAKQLAESCSCPTIDSPDDMIIGMCARRFSIPVFHSAAFHQAQPMDYAELYLKRIQPISFHKFEELDPYEVYMKWLHEDMPKQTVHALHESSRHTEL